MSLKYPFFPLSSITGARGAVPAQGSRNEFEYGSTFSQKCVRTQPLKEEYSVWRIFVGLLIPLLIVFLSNVLKTPFWKVGIMPHSLCQPKGWTNQQESTLCPCDNFLPIQQPCPQRDYVYLTHKARFGNKKASLRCRSDIWGSEQGLAKHRSPCEITIGALKTRLSIACHHL